MERNFLKQTSKFCWYFLSYPTRELCLCFWCCCFALAYHYHWTPYPFEKQLRLFYIPDSSYDCCISIPLYYYLSILATGGRIPSFNISSSLWLYYLWCLHCGPNCPIFLCFSFFFFFFFFWLFPPSATWLRPQLLYLHLFSFLFHSNLSPLFLSRLVAFLHHSSFRCGLLHLRQ
jgi:hypothetical protein